MLSTIVHLVAVFVLTYFWSYFPVAGLMPNQPACFRGQGWLEWDSLLYKIHPEIRLVLAVSTTISYFLFFVM